MTKEVSIILITGFLLVLTTALANFELPTRANINEQCQPHSRATGNIKIMGSMLHIECKHNNGTVEIKVIRL
jgi:hypothetical protein